MPPLKIAVMLGLILGWTGPAAAQSGVPADAGRPTPSADDLPPLDRAAAQLRNGQETNVGYPVGRIANPSTNGADPADRLTTSPTQDGLAIRPTAKTPASPSPSPPPTSSIPQAARSGDRLAISPSHHVRLGEPGSRPGAVSSLLTVGSSLAVVLGLFLLVAWMFKRALPGQSGLLPREVVEVLGRTSLGARQQVHLVRCGNKLLLVSSTPGGMETLTEIAEPDEVQRLSALCRQTQPGSSTAAFRQVFQQLARGASHDA